MKILKIIYFNLILEWDGLLRILKIRPDELHPLEIVLFLMGHQKQKYVLNWLVWKILSTFNYK